MKIAFLSSLNPYDINNWSGTLYHMIHSLMNQHEVTWIGAEIMQQVYNYHHSYLKENEDAPCAVYDAPLYGRFLSEWLQRATYDVIVARDYFFIAFLKTDLPVVYVGDNTFEGFNQYGYYDDPRFIRLADEVERRAIVRSQAVVYSSEWARQSAIGHYKADPDKIHVVEFGANMDELPSHELQLAADGVCNLLFIGKEWSRKGGQKTLDIYHALKKQAFACTLTLVGCDPANLLPLDDPDIRVIPFVDKSKTEDRERLHAIFCDTHFFVLPTFFDCFGIVFCEASAFSIPSFTHDTAGVSQVVRDGKNGYLFDLTATAAQFAAKIMSTFQDKPSYAHLRHTSRIEFETRLNWRVWEQKMNKVLESVASSRAGTPRV